MDRFTANSRRKSNNIIENTQTNDLDTIFNRYPIVYTTRLNEMAIFSKDLKNANFKDIIQTIITESKPRYRPSHYNSITKINIIHEFNNHAKSYQQSDYISTLTNCKTKTEIFKNVFNNCNKHIDVLEKPEIKTEIKEKNLNKLERLLALCKPLKVVLEDINKTVSIVKDETITEVFSILSDSEDDVKANEPNINNIDINDFKTILREKDLKHTVLVINKTYLKEIDAYQIDERHKVIDHKIIKNAEVDIFLNKNCNLILNITVCCWRNRQAYVSLLMNYKQYIDIAKCIVSAHSCKQRCSCCCFVVSESYDHRNDVNDSVTLDNSSNNTQSSEQNSKLIDAALKFKTDLKWNRNPKDCGLTNKPKPNYSKYNKRLLQINNTNGQVEYYEICSDCTIFSKLVANGLSESCWLLKMLSKCRFKTHFTFTDPKNRERQIKSYRYMMTFISVNQECFLRKPIMLVKENVKKTKLFSHHSAPVIEHTSSLIGKSSKQSKILSVIPGIRKKNTTTPHFTLSIPPDPSISPAPSSSLLHSPPNPTSKLTHASQTPRQPPQPSIMDQEVTETIINLIKKILHRFRDVFLLINNEGKVSAALNVPLTSLTYSELKILQQILGHAQGEVDKLGLSSGKCSELATMIKSANKIITSSAHTSIDSGQSDADKNVECEQQKVIADEEISTLNNLMDTISTETMKSKNLLSNNLRNTFETLNQPSCPWIDVLELPSEEQVNPIDVDTVTSNDAQKNVELLNELYMDEILGKMAILDNKIKPKQQNNRRRKSAYLSPAIRPPKMKVKTAGDIVDNPGGSPDVFRDLKVSESLKSFPSTSSNSLLRNLLEAEPKKLPWGKFPTSYQNQNQYL